jgi:hypothetical protein
MPAPGNASRSTDRITTPTGPLLVRWCPSPSHAFFCGKLGCSFGCARATRTWWNGLRCRGACLAVDRERLWKRIACPILEVLPDLLTSRLAAPDPVRTRGAAQENNAARDEAPREIPRAIDESHDGDAANGTKDWSGETDKIPAHRSCSLRSYQVASKASVALAFFIQLNRLITSPVPERGVAALCFVVARSRLLPIQDPDSPERQHEGEESQDQDVLRGNHRDGFLLDGGRCRNLNDADRTRDQG